MPIINYDSEHYKLDGGIISFDKSNNEISNKSLKSFD